MSSATEASQKFVLGLDLGSASLGWALLALDERDSLTGLIDAGVRIFEPGVDGTSLDIELGKDQSKAVDRRVARLHRRQLRRRAGRQRELFQLLQRSGMFPVSGTGGGASPEQRHQILNEFDKALSVKFAEVEGDSFAQMPLYLLRKRALYDPLELFELGRIFFHLSQRRGFLSNRKDLKKSGKENEDVGQVKNAIHALDQAIKAAGAQTLGEYFAGLDPHLVAVRRRWTGRAMFQKEFSLIWEKQAPHHAAIMTAELRKDIDRLLFYQRPIAKQDKLIGRCELEPEERRAVGNHGGTAFPHASEGK